MKWNNLILLAGLVSLFNSCLKNSENPGTLNEKLFITEARNFFDTLTRARQYTIFDYKSLSPRKVLWNQTRTYRVPNGYALTAPVEYELPLFVKTEFTENKVFHLNDLSEVLIYRDSNKLFQLEVLTKFPDISYLNDPSREFSGFVFVDDWYGNNINKYLLGNAETRVYHPINVQTESIIRTCNVIYGYNYAINDPDHSYSWMSTGGCYYMYVPDRLDDVHGGGLGGGLGSAGGGGLSGRSITLAPPDNPIANIVDYNKCFTNVGGNDHTYTVTICVQQPIPGSRAAFKWVDGGPIGSSNDGNIVNVGHTFLIFSEQYGNTLIVRNVGFYPSTGVKPGSSTSPGQLNNDESHSYNLSATFSVTNANFFLMLNATARGNSSGFYYNLNSENCTTFALQTLAQGGVNLPNTIGSWPGGMGCNPGDLGEDIKLMSALPNMTRSTVQNYHPNKGSCQ